MNLETGLANLSESFVNWIETLLQKLETIWIGQTHMLPPLNVPLAWHPLPLNSL